MSVFSIKHNYNLATFPFFSSYMHVCECRLVFFSTKLNVTIIIILGSRDKKRDREKEGESECFHLSRRRKITAAEKECACACVCVCVLIRRMMMGTEMASHTRNANSVSY